MLIIAVLLVILGVISAQDCGRRSLKPAEDHEKVVGGVEALRGDWPWMCSMQYNGHHVCGGSLINNKWVITAAHCAFTTNPSNYQWKCGDHDRHNAETYTQTLRVSRVINHPKYDSRMLLNDISLFELSTPAVPTDYVLPVCYPAFSDVYGGKTSWATGWGVLQYGASDSSRYLMEVAVPVLTDLECRNKYISRYMAVNTTIQVCAGAMGGNKDTCGGDSGGPLVVKHDDGRWYLIGITSWGIDCGDGGVYTRVSAFRSWVEGYTGKL